MFVFHQGVPIKVPLAATGGGTYSVDGADCGEFEHELPIHKLPVQSGDAKTE